VTIATESARTPLLTGHRPWWRSRLGLVGAIVGLVLAGFLVARREFPWPDSLAWNTLGRRLDDFQRWLIAERSSASPNPLFAVFDAFRVFVDNLVTWLNDFLLWMTWPGTAAVGTLLVLRYGGRRAALIMLGAFATFALTGVWEESMQTLALMLSAVALSLLVGMPLGVLAGRSERFRNAITPVLDAAQIVPPFAYLMPVVILFSVGPGAAVVSTMIYTVPVAVRITALGIRSVPPNTVEAAEAMGATRLQTLVKVQLPLARRMLLLAVNQTILFALSMVVIAGLIGGRGLGDVVTSGLYSYPARALLGGIVIVILAVALDRATAAIADRTETEHRHVTDERRRRLRLLTGATFGGAIGAVAVARLLGAAGVYPDEFETATTVYQATVADQLLDGIQAALEYVQDPSSFVFAITEPIGNFLVQYGLEPLRALFVETPWFVVLAGAVAIAFVLSGARPALTAFAMLAAIGVLGVWNQAMDTASQVVVATALAVAVGFLLGVWAAESPRVSRVVRPVNDIFQTLPQLVYIIPFIYLMPVSRVPGIVAGVLYAVPVVIRLVERGIRDVAQPAVEAAAAYGATRAQILLKVKIPLARDAIMLGVNQGTIMVLAVVVIGGLVGSGALGDEVARGLQRNEFGQGVVASLAILALGIALDRVTQGERRAGPRGLGLRSVIRVRQRSRRSA
jgi:glycine betaine/proline transport system permease protein